MAAPATPQPTPNPIGQTPMVTPPVPPPLDDRTISQASDMNGQTSGQWQNAPERKQAEKQVAQADDALRQTNKTHRSLAQKIVSRVQTLTGSDSADSPQEAFKPFIILGSAFMLFALGVLLFTATQFWVILALAAVIQLTMGTLLKNNSR